MNRFNKTEDAIFPMQAMVLVVVLLFSDQCTRVAGKTTILYRFKLNETINTVPTIGFNVETLTPTKGLELTVWDMGGQERMRPLWRMYLRGTDGMWPTFTPIVTTRPFP